MIDIWDLDQYKVEEKNSFSDVIDNKVYFDFWNREAAIRELFNQTSDPDVKKEVWHLPEEQQWEIRRNAFLGNTIDALCGSNNELWQKIEELEKRVKELEEK